MKHCSVIITIYGLLYVGAMIGITISNQNINTIALIIISLYLAYVSCIKFKIIFHNKTTFFETIRSNTLYSSFKNSLLDENDASQSNDALLKILHMMLVAGISFMAVCFIINVIGDGEKLGPFGDFLGGVLNPIFTLMTFFGVIVTIVLQKIELGAAREEYKKSADALGTQAIENTFFSMLSLHHGIVENLHFSTDNFNMDGNILKNTLARSQAQLNIFKLNGESARGAASFSALLKLLNTYSVDESDTIKIYKYIQENHNHLFGHYFRNLYQIIKFIDTNKHIDEIDKKKYISILRSQISTYETVALFINCYQDVVDDGKFRYLLIKYHMLEHMPITKSRDSNRDAIYKITNFNFIIASSKTIKDFLSSEQHAEGHNGAFGKMKLDFSD
ncbi:putative phage abortive infection protein [Aeromonas veronii]|uniref:putative phage abortive infection protein n=1 Tax=Aeromonas veronii TaxID=654 RepID=UPI001F23CF9D|nr:putative phage abortive infection protein [Aeromonas veronii]MCF5885415.1 putative phage abortive infection protein [Aeromonas veronii]